MHLGTINHSCKMPMMRTLQYDGRRRREKAVIIAIITVLFFIYHTPFTVYVQITDFDITTSTSSDIFGSLWTTIFVLLNSMFNPIVYYVWVQSIWNAFKAQICKGKSQFQEG